MGEGWRPEGRSRKSARRFTPAGIDLVSAEEVFGGGAAEGGGAGAVVGGDEAVEAADEGGGDLAVLAADEVGCCCWLVGDGDLGGLQLAVVGVGAAAPVV